MKIIYILSVIIFNICFAASENPSPGYIILSQYDSVDINIKDEITISTQIAYKIMNEDGIKLFNIFKLHYDNQIEDVQISYAKIINDQIAQNIDVKNNSSNSKISSNEQVALAQKTEIAFAIPNLKVNSILKVGIETKLKKNLFSKYFSQRFYIGQNTYIKNYLFTANSIKPIFIHTNFPQNENIKFNTTKIANNNYRIEANTENLFGNFLTNPLAFQFRQDQYYITVSTSNNWEPLRKELSDLFYSQINKPIPLELKKIIENIKKEATEEKRIEKTLEYITSNYRYLGNWQDETGLLIPKDVNKTIKDKFGDCKDFATLFIIMLKELNIVADYSLVERNLIPNQNFEKDIVDLKNFNHVITRVTLKDKIYWIDPTNFKSVGFKVRKDILNKMVLNLNTKLATFEKVTAPTEDSISKIETTYEYDKTNINGSFSAELKGEPSRIISDELTKLERKNQDLFFKSFINEPFEITIINDVLPNFNNKAYEPISFKYNFANKERIKLNEAGNILNFKIKQNAKFLLPTDIPSSTYNVLLSNNISFERVDHYKNMYLINDTPRRCEIEYNGIYFYRNSIIQKDGFDLITKLIFKKEYLENKLIKSNNFELFYDAFDECSSDEEVNISTKAGHHSIKSDIFNETLTKLPKNERIKKRIEATDAILQYPGNLMDHENSNNYVEDLLLKNLSEEPLHIETLNNLGLLYEQKSYHSGEDYELSTLEKAHNYYLKAFEQNPKDHTTLIRLLNYYKITKQVDRENEIYNTHFANLSPAQLNKKNIINLASYLYNVGKLNQAKIFFDYVMPRLDYTDKEKSKFYFYQGKYFANHDRNLECVKSFEQVIKLNPKNIWSYINISVCLEELKQFDKVIVYSQKGYELSKRPRFLNTIKENKAKLAISNIKNNQIKNAEILATESLKIEESEENILALTIVNILKNNDINAASYFQRLISVSNISKEEAAILISNNCNQDQLSQIIKFLLTQRKNDGTYEDQLTIIGEVLKSFYEESNSKAFELVYKIALDDFNDKKIKASSNDNKQFAILCAMEIIFARMVLENSKKNFQDLIILRDEIFNLSPNIETRKRVKYIMSAAKELPL